MFEGWKVYPVNHEGFLYPAISKRGYYSHLGMFEGPVITARCAYENMPELQAWDTEPHTMFDVNCTCGIYLAKSGILVRDYIQPIERDSDILFKKFTIPGWKALTKVRLYGTVVEHEYGFKASHALITEIKLLTSGRRFTTAFIKSLADRYQCDANEHLIKDMGQLMQLTNELKASSTM